MLKSLCGDAACSAHWAAVEGVTRLAVTGKKGPPSIGSPGFAPTSEDRVCDAASTASQARRSHGPGKRSWRYPNQPTGLRKARWKEKGLSRYLHPQTHGARDLKPIGFDESARRKRPFSFPHADNRFRRGRIRLPSIASREPVHHGHRRRPPGS